MEAYRDQYATLFNNGQGVTVLAISTDDQATLADWAREKEFPVTFLSDAQAAVGQLYDVKIPAVNFLRRVVFVVGPDGRVTHVMRPFRELSGEAYTELGQAVRRASGTGG
jgi:peroxiredoxin